MANNILPFAKYATARLASRLRETPADEILPLLNSYLHRAVNRLRVTDSKTLVPLLTHYLGAAFPGRGTLTIRGLREINTGWENDVYSFSAVWGGFGHAQKEDLILRVFPGANSQQRGRTEYDTLKMLNGVGYPVPRVDLFVGADKSPFCKPFMVMERIDGHDMCRDLFHSGPQSYEHYLPVFCGLLARLHALDWRSIMPDPQRFEPTDEHCTIERTMELSMPFIENNISPGFIPLWDWFLARSHDVTCPDPCIVHLDYHANNLLVKNRAPTGGSEVSVIDWTASTVTDYRFDLAWTLMLTGSLNGWEKREDILREYQRQAGKVVEDMDFFDVGACFTRLFGLIIAQQYGADAIGFRPGAEELMRRQAASMRLVYEHQLKITGISIPEVETFLDEEKV